MSVLVQYLCADTSASNVAANSSASSLSNSATLPSFAFHSTYGFATDPVLRATPFNGSTNSSNAIANNSYYGFSIKPSSGYTVSFTSLTFDVAQPVAGDIRGYVVRTSVDGYTTTIASADSTAVAATFQNVSVDLSGGAYQTLTTGLGVRIYIYTPGSGSGLLFDNHTFNGSINAISTSTSTGGSTSTSTDLVVSFNGRTGEVTSQQSDYDSFFLTQSEGDARYLLSTSTAVGVSSFNGRTGAVSPSSGDYSSYYLTQADANSQGMPAVEAVSYSGSSIPSSPVSYGTGNIILRAPTTPSDYWQTRLNTSTDTVSVSASSGYSIHGSTTISAGVSALFIKESTTAFRRWS